MSLMQKLEDFVDRITTGEQMQYVLAGTLILIIIISLLTVILNLTGGSRRYEITEMHFYCLETGKEFVIKPEDMYAHEEMMDPGMMGPMGRYLSPYTNERTAVPMTRCPNCKKWFVPDYYFQEGYSEDEYYMPEHEGNLVCPHCNTDILQWYRDRRKRRR